MPIEHIPYGDSVVLRFARPPVNALDRVLAEELARDIASVGGQPGVRAIVLVGAGTVFCAGAEIDELGTDPAQVGAIRALMQALDASPVPVVAAIHGAAYGGGLELALACHARIAAVDARLAFPEVSLGLLPGAGGTQRTPRLVGADAALSLMLTGKPVDAAYAHTIGLIDAIADGDLLPQALRFASSMASRCIRSRDRSVPIDGAKAAIARARDATAVRRDGADRAAAFIVDCVEAAFELEFDCGQALEIQRFDELLASATSRALRQVFLGERSAARLPTGVIAAEPVAIRHVAVVGAGTMGSGIAIALLGAGMPVALVDPDREALDRARDRIVDSIDRDVQKGRITPSLAGARIAALAASTDLEAAVAAADLVIEAVFEDMAVKRQVFAALDAATPPGAILATNTSTLDVDVIADAVRDPGRVVGLHFFSPAQVMRLVEIVRGARTRPGVLATVMAFTRQIGKIGVVAGVCDGFIGNRMFEEYLRQAYFLLEEGALPQQVDRALESFGFAMGPFRVMDLAGQDIGWNIRKRRALEQPDRPYSAIPDLICELGRFGQKSGSGFYLYPDGRTAMVDPEIDALIMVHSERIGVRRRSISDAEIVERCVLALVNEGARILDEGVAWRASDIDVVWTAGYGFPAVRGGPIFHAEELGLSRVLATIERFRTGYQGWAWQPAQLLTRRVRANRALSDG